MLHVHVQYMHMYFHIETASFKIILAESSDIFSYRQWKCWSCGNRPFIPSFSIEPTQYDLVKATILSSCDCQGCQCPQTIK